MTSGTAALDGGRMVGNFAVNGGSRKRDHRFYTGMAFAIAIGISAGFTRTYYARGYFHSPTIPLLIQIHGAVFTARMLLYVLQNLLAMNGGMRMHRNLGLMGVILSAAV